MDNVQIFWHRVGPSPDFVIITSILYMSHVQDIVEYVKLRQTIDRYLGPLCHGDRYTSFGRHFTKPEIMDRVVERVMEYIADGDIVIDMTCGANTFVPAIKKRAKEKGGKVLSTYSADKFHSQHALPLFCNAPSPT